MVLVSIHPFALRKLLLVIAAFLCFTALCFADPVLMVHRYAPSRQSPAVKSPSVAPQSLEATPESAPFGLITPSATRPESKPAQSNLLLSPPPSSLARKAMCELQPSDFTALVAARPDVLFPSEN